MQTTISRLENLKVAMRVEDSRLKISGSDREGELRIVAEDAMPLGEHGRAVALSLLGEDMSAEVELTADDVDALVETLQDAKAHLQEGRA